MRSVIEEQLPGRRGARAGPPRATCSASAGVFTADQSRRILEAAAGFGMALAPPRRRAGPVGRRGARGGARRVVGRSPPHAERGRGRGAVPRPPAAITPPSRRCCPATTLVPHGRRGRAGATVHRRGRPGRPRHRLQPRDLAHAEPPARDDRRVPRDEALPRGGARGRDHQRGLRRRGGRPGGLDRARQAGGPRRLARGQRRPSCPTGSAPTSSTSS